MAQNDPANSAVIKFMTIWGMIWGRFGDVFFQNFAFFLAGSAYKHIGNGVRKWAGRRPPMSKIHQNDENLTLSENAH